ncbi:hypothetical protein [Aquitalea sp. LB_tupeE]|uniref:hypothetical protein n=1 Tax=Aquitalea sp. LB_tupeE TaxID=2748078 RepID=UPI001C4D39B6|nr:hypothetical protein [Aquitalea sp. LB_tupeE]
MIAVELLESLNLLDENEHIEVKRDTKGAGIDNDTYRELNKVDALAASGALCRLRDARQGGDEAGLPTKSSVLSANLEALSYNFEVLPTNPSPNEEIARRALLATLLGDLALLLHSDSHHVRNSYPRPLMWGGRLVIINPDEPNDPQQAYRTEEGGNGN